MDNLAKLISLMNEYQNEIAKNHQEREEIKRRIQHNIIEKLKSELETEENNERLQKYLEDTKIADLNFLDRSLKYMRGNNQDGSLTAEKFVFLNDEIRNIVNSYNVYTENQLFNIIVDYHYLKKPHPLLMEKVFIEFWNKMHTLAYLDEFFKDINNCLAYQGAYTTYKYVKRYLKEVLSTDNPEDNQELIYKDIKPKINIVTKNLSLIANEILTLRNNIPGSRISVCNQGLRRTANKKENSPITFDQKVFIEAIAFGTTLEKLNDENYEDAKQLLYIPHQIITK